MKTVTIRQTIEFDLTVPDDWNNINGLCGKHLTTITSTKDKEFSKHYDDVYEIEDEYDRCSVPHSLRTINTEIIDNNEKQY